MHASRNTYVLVPLVHPGPVLTDALGVYARNIALSIKTATNEIEYWASRYNTTFEDTLLLFALIKNGTVIGFSQMVFFSTEELLVVDYMVIESGQRQDNAIFEFKEQIERYLDEREFHPKHVVMEIPFFSARPKPSEAACKLMRLLKFAGFGVVKSCYYQPLHGTTNADSYMPATLMVLRNDPAHSMKRETFLSVVSTIYYKHYLRWYEPFPNTDHAAYRSHIDELWGQVVSRTPPDTVDINGFPTESADPRPSGNRRSRRLGDVWRFCAASVLLLVTVFLVLAWAERWFHLTTASVSVFVMLSLLVVLAMLSLFFPRAFEVFKKILSSLPKSSRKRG